MKIRPLVRQLTALLLVSLATQASATGYFGPAVYLDQGGKRVAASPEFYWELEVKRLARDFHPTEKLSPRDLEPFATSEDRKIWNDRFTAKTEAADFADALRTGRIKPPDPAEATREDAAARAVLNQTRPTSTEALPPEFPSEFADYHRGAFAYRRGPDHWEEARQAWEDLLKRPEAERHYRTVWATFMLGKIAMKRKDLAAVHLFQQTRALAKSGFADSLGMAADSYGWEGRSEWKQDHPEKAAPLFLTQLALGDESAIVSLKALIPDRNPVEGMLNYSPEPAGNPDADALRTTQENAAILLERDVRDPLLRRLITAHILALASVPDEFVYGPDRRPDRCQRWLELVENLKLSKLKDAEYLGWVAYNAGDYRSATRWLDLAPHDSPAGLWLRAKLLRRDGKLKEAAMSMAEAWKTLRDPAAYTGWNGSMQPLDTVFLGPHWTFPQSAGGDLGALHLERNEFSQALQTLLDGKLWSSAAFVAERILTTAELEKFVAQHPAPANANEDDYRVQLRYLLGRRLVRDKRYADAGKFMLPPWDQVLARYGAALQSAHDKKLSHQERAHAFFTAAWLARHDGMELMGFEGAPDGFVNGGEFPMLDVAAEMSRGTYKETSYADGETQVATKRVALRVTKDERHRLTKSKPGPDLRYHYRIGAAALALEAAYLLPDDSAELADVLNRAGLWVKDEDEKLADGYFQIMERRAAQTAIGRAAVARHWFVDQAGPWSEAAGKAEVAMRQELHVPAAY